MHNTLLLLLWQITDTVGADTTAAVAETGPDQLRIIDLLLKGGWAFMIPLLILSILAVYIFIERWIVINSAARVDKNFMTGIRESMLKGNIKGAIQSCQEEDTPIARMVEKGIKRIGKPLRSIEVAIENVGKLELLKLENRLTTLATIAGAAPMIGFLGTVTGMINAFYQIANADSNVDPGVLAGGIYQALVTTAAGLAIGIIAFIGYNFLVSRVQKVIYKMEATTVDFVDFLQEPAK